MSDNLDHLFDRFRPEALEALLKAVEGGTMTRIRRKDLARKLMVAPSTVSSWKTRYPDFPKPIGRYYDLDAVMKWKANHDIEQSGAGKSIPEPPTELLP